MLTTTTQRVAPSQGCVSCGYDLVGLTTGGVCPECGTDISESLRGDLLRFADARYLRALVRGATLASIGIMALIAAPFCMLLAGLVLGSAGGLIPILAMLLGCCGWGAGLWILSIPDPRAGERDAVHVLRVWIRSSAGLLVCACALIVGFDLVVQTPGSLGGVIAAAAIVLGGAGQLGLLIAGNMLAGRIAARVPDLKLRAQFTASARWIVGLAVLLFVGRLLPLGGFPAIGLVTAALWLALLVKLASFAGAMLSLRKQLAEAQHQLAFTKLVDQEVRDSGSAAQKDGD